MQRAACLLLLSLGFAPACGGRYESTGHDEPAHGVGGATAGSTSAAGGAIASSGSSGANACAQQEQAYADERDRLIAQFSSFGCMQDSDCVVFYNQTACDSSCTLTTTAARRGLIDGLNNFALSNCSSECLPSFVPFCAPPPPPHCSAGRCVLLQ